MTERDEDATLIISRDSSKLFLRGIVKTDGVAAERPEPKHWRLGSSRGS